MIQLQTQAMPKPLGYKLIDRPDAIDSAMACLSRFSSLALDLEMENNLHYYGLHIAVIQISTPDKRHYVFDPLAGLDLKPLGALLADPKVELIMHDTEFDQRTCNLVYGWKLTNLFDTKIAAQLCGIREFGLGILLDKLLDIKISKKYQKADWLKRPLKPEMLDYAVNDTAHLHKLQEVLLKKLKEIGRLDWAREEFAAREKTTFADASAPDHYRIKKSSHLTPRQLAMLKNLVKFRDKVARALNRPAHFIMGDAILLEMAVSPPEKVQVLKQMKGIHPALKHGHYAEHLIRAVALGRKAPEDAHPAWRKKTNVKPGYRKRLDNMRKWRTGRAAQLSLEPQLVMPTDVLHWSACNSAEPLPKHIATQVRPWQREHVWAEFQKNFVLPELQPAS